MRFNGARTVLFFRKKTPCEFNLKTKQKTLRVLSRSYGVGIMYKSYDYNDLVSKKKNDRHSRVSEEKKRLVPNKNNIFHSFLYISIVRCRFYEHFLKRKFLLDL